MTLPLVPCNRRRARGRADSRPAGGRAAKPRQPIEPLDDRSGNRLVSARRAPGGRECSARADSCAAPARDVVGRGPASCLQIDDRELEVGVPVVRIPAERPAKSLARPLAVAETPREDPGDDVGLAAEDVEPAGALEPVECGGGILPRDRGRRPRRPAPRARAAHTRSTPRGGRPLRGPGSPATRSSRTARRTASARPATALPRAPARRRPGRPAQGSPRTSRPSRATSQYENETRPAAASAARVGSSLRLRRAAATAKARNPTKRPVPTSPVWARSLNSMLCG